ncbi:ABC transporter substrate-binding protein [Nocardia sp. NPDC127579]|uniref:ABC transporter substrate-binding protein n=1 Tax=Nocardia sp. NPDC127579 TaxID=3345402 RepID=UPI003643F18F
MFRSTRVGALLIATTIGLSATLSCAGPGDNGTPAPVSTGMFPRTLDTTMGPVTIPAPPRRVMVLDTAELDSVTLLGITPIGAVVPPTKTRGGYPGYLHGKADTAIDVGPLLEPNLERIASLRPDLILSSKLRHERIYDKLSRIAPTVFTETTGGPWKANLAVHASALGLEQQAAAALASYEARARALGASIRERNGGTPPVVSVIRFLAGSTRLYLSNSYSGVVLADIGLRRPAAQIASDPDAKNLLELSPERIDQADADLVFVATIDDVDKTKKQEFTTGPLWRDLPAVKRGMVFEVDDEVWMSGIGVQAAESILSDVAAATGAQLPTR